MLLKIHQQKLQQWLNLLLNWQKQLELNNFSFISRENLQPIIIFFKKEILILNNDLMESSLLSIWQSFLTESNRCLRLLETDIFFFLSAKTETNKQTRFNLIQNRVNLVISYCQQLIVNTEGNR
jgi:hypothetical protein